MDDGLLIDCDDDCDGAGDVDLFKGNEDVCKSDGEDDLLGGNREGKDDVCDDAGDVDLFRGSCEVDDEVFNDVCDAIRDDVEEFVGRSYFLSVDEEAVKAPLLCCVGFLLANAFLSSSRSFRRFSAALLSAGLS